VDDLKLHQGEKEKKTYSVFGRQLGPNFSKFGLCRRQLRLQCRHHIVSFLLLLQRIMKFVVVVAAVVVLSKNIILAA
jgi:hypothetical protein